MKDIRRHPVLYRFYDDEGRVLYIGSSWTPHLRWQKHEDAGWFLEVAAIAVEHYNDVAEMRRAESAAILAEQPRYNVRDRGIGYKNPYGHWRWLANLEGTGNP